MKLFTNKINEELYAQFFKNSDLANQKVVAKIFNPYGRGTWYLLNSDPNEPDYIWAIVDFYDIEIGSVSRSELQNLRVPPFNLGLERDMSFRQVNAQELYNGLRSGKHYGYGGDIAEQNKAMLENQAIQLQHHSEELLQTIKNKEDVAPWVIAKAERAATDLSDITHYMEGKAKADKADEIDEFDAGGQISQALGDSIYDTKEAVESSIAYLVDADNYKVLHNKETGKWLLTPVKRAKQFLSAGWDYFGFPSKSKLENGGDLDDNYALGGMMQAGRFYKDKQGNIYRYIGEGLFMNKDGEYEKKQTSDFYEDGGELKDEFLEDMAELHGDIKSVTLKDDSVISQDELAKANNVMAGGGGTSSPNIKFMKWFVDWLKDVNKYVHVSISIPNEFSSPIKDNNGKIVMLDIIEKKGDSDAKKYMNEILKKADEFGVSIYLEPIPRTHNLKYQEHKNKITKEYLIKYYEKFGFEKTNGGFMVREPKMAGGGGINDKRDSLLNYAYPTVKDIFKENGLKLEENYAFTDGSNKSYIPHLNYKREGDVLQEVYVTYYGDAMEVIGVIKLEVKDEKVEVKVEFPDWDIKNEQTFAKGGLTRYEDKVAAIKASLLKRKKVSPKVQKDYGKTYSPAEAEDSAKRIAGAMTAKERLMKLTKKRKKNK